MAEGGELPNRAQRIARARGASARAWLRHVARALAAEWPQAPEGLVVRLDGRVRADLERLEALCLEEDAVVERRGRSGDAEADRRDADLAARCRLFAESLAALAEREEPPPAVGRRVSEWLRARTGERRAVEAEAQAAWGAGTASAPERPMTAASTAEPELARVLEAAAVWAHARMLCEAIEQVVLAPPPPAPASAGPG